MGSIWERETVAMPHYLTISTKLWNASLSAPPITTVITHINIVLSATTPARTAMHPHHPTHVAVVRQSNSDN
jgi:hypothetical protein